MNRFYQPDIATTLTLCEDESHHAVKVLRLAEGDDIEVVDGKGNLYRCRITLAHAKRCRVDIVETIDAPNHWHHPTVIAVAPAKHLDRNEWMLEKCVEMGIDRFVPLLCHNSERTAIKTERLEKIAVAAMKQSLKAVMPDIAPITPLRQLIAQPFDGQRFIAYCDPALPRDRRLALAEAYRPGNPVMVLIGPEGDFSPEEVETAIQAGFIPVTLGHSRLRTETAAVMACATIHTIDQFRRNDA